MTPRPRFVDTLSYYLCINLNENWDDSAEVCYFFHDQPRTIIVPNPLHRTNIRNQWKPPSSTMRRSRSQSRRNSSLALSKPDAQAAASVRSLMDWPIDHKADDDDDNGLYLLSLSRTLHHRRMRTPRPRHLKRPCLTLKNKHSVACRLAKEGQLMITRRGQK